MNSTLQKWLFRPFDYLSEYTALWIGLSAILLAGLLNSLGHTHFDGTLDAHFNNKLNSVFVYVAEGGIDWLALAGLLFIGALLFSPSSIRLIDVLAMQAFARTPMLLTAIYAVCIPYNPVTDYIKWKYLQQGVEVPVSLVDFVLFGLLLMVTLACTIWMVVLMFRAFCVSCNLKGTKAGLVFTVAVLLSEILSKYLIHLLNKI